MLAKVSVTCKKCITNVVGVLGERERKRLNAKARHWVLSMIFLYANVYVARVQADSKRYIFSKGQITATFTAAISFFVRNIECSYKNGFKILVKWSKN